MVFVKFVGIEFRSKGEVLGFGVGLIGIVVVWYGFDFI